MIEPRRVLCEVCPCPPHVGECGRDIEVPEEMTSGGAYVARCYCTHRSSPSLVAVDSSARFSARARRVRRSRRGGLR